MWILVAIIGGLLLVALVSRLRTLRAGARFSSQLLTGNFDDSRVGRLYASWFSERPSREVQRQNFVQLASAMGCPSGELANRVMRSIARAWREPQVGYGAIVAEEIDELVTFDPATTDAQKESQRIARSRLNDLKDQLRRLDDE